MNLDVYYDWGNIELHPACQKVIKSAADSVLYHKPKKILDIGCGNGYLCRILSDHEVECVGLEPISDAVDYANKLVPEGKFYVRPVMKIQLKMV